MEITIYTDGAARGNPDGPGGYGAIIEYRDEDGLERTRELSGGFPRTTNNRMELMGVIAALEALADFGEPCKGTVYSDSSYVVNAFEKRWISNWQKNGWKTASGGEVKNRDLWNRLLAALAPHRISFRWVKGHAGHPENERCDALATAAADKAGRTGRQEREEEGIFPPRPAGAAGPAGPGSAGKAGPAGPGSAGKAGPAGPGSPGKAGSAPLRVRIRYLSDRIDKLRPPTDSANWVDLRAAEDVEMKQGDYRLVRLGVAMELPAGYEAHVVPRSSAYKNFGVIQANHYGVIDSTYCGDKDEWMVPLIALRDTKIHVNDRICQFRVERRQPDIVFEEVDCLGGEGRGGFGSTGIQ